MVKRGTDSPEPTPMIHELQKMVIVSIAFGLFIAAAQMAAGVPLYGIKKSVEIASR